MHPAVTFREWLGHAHFPDVRHIAVWMGGLVANRHFLLFIRILAIITVLIMFSVFARSLEGQSLSNSGFV